MPENYEVMHVFYFMFIVHKLGFYIYILNPLKITSCNMVLYLPSVLVFLHLEKKNILYCWILTVLLYKATFTIFCFLHNLFNLCNLYLTYVEILRVL